MKNARTRIRLLLTALPTSLIGVALFFLPIFIPVGFVRDQLSQNLRQHVRVKSSSLSWAGPTVLEEVELCADGTCPAWLKSGKIQAETGLWQAISQSNGPDRLFVKGAELHLELSADGKVLTQFPKGGGSTGPLPSIQLEDALLRIHQEGHPPLIINQIQGELTPKGEGFALNFQSKDPNWGFPSGKGTAILQPVFELDLHVESTKEVKVAPGRLKEIPFVPTDVWETVKLEGTTPVVFDLGLHPKNVTYAVRVQPKQTSVEIPVIGFRAQEAQGTVLVSTGKVVFQNICGKAYDGSIRLPEGEFLFLEAGKKIKLDLDVQDFSMKALPESWGDPKLLRILPLNARMSGMANILISWGENQPLRLGGGGEGKVRTTVLGITQSEWALHLRSLGDRLIVIPELSGFAAPLGIFRRRQ